jgi:hypothetical protein
MQVLLSWDWLQYAWHSYALLKDGVQKQRTPYAGDLKDTYIFGHVTAGLNMSCKLCRCCCSTTAYTTPSMEVLCCWLNV